MRGRRWETAWRSTIGPRVTEVIEAGQQASAAAASAYMTAVLTELGIEPEVPTVLNPLAFAGVTGAGNPLEAATYGAVITAAKSQYEPQMANLSPIAVEQAALAEAEEYMAGIVETILADAARAAEAVALAQRPWVKGWVRMIEPGACSRCVILAGAFYLYNEGFERHERCRCKHIPADENIATDMLTNPNAYFDSLGRAEQDRVFTNAGAEAIRLGADIRQVVNARRGMNTAQQNPRGWIPRGQLEAVTMFGHDTFVTTEGVTKRGVYGKTRGKKPVRLMPESILALAENRDDALRLLRLYGYLLDR